MDCNIRRMLPFSLALLFSVGCVTPPPRIAPPAGIYACPLNVSITDQKSDAAIYYTIDGGVPSTSSNRYSAPFPVSAAGKVQAIAQSSGAKPSNLTQAGYTCAMTRAEFAILLQQT